MSTDTPNDARLNESNLDEGLSRVLSRNLFYRGKFRFVLGCSLLVLLFDIMLAVIAHYIFRHPVQPLYFPADNAGRLIQEVPLQEPNLTNQVVANWAANAIQAAYSYDFTNYHTQLQSAQQYFTDAGWAEYMKGLDRSRNMDALTERKLVVVAKVVGAPVLEKYELWNGRLAWRFEVPVLMYYLPPPFDGKEAYSNPLTVTVVVVRQDVLLAKDGLGVVQMNAALAS